MANFELEPWYQNHTPAETREAEILEQTLSIGSFTLEQLVEIED